MIVFLTLCYCAVLALLVKFGVVKLTLWWKLSPLVWMLLLLIVLFIPMQWGAPAGPVNVYKSVVEIVPNVTGEVIDVPISGLQSLKKGDVLFQIDPTPYAAKVTQLKAQLAESQQKVKQLAAAAEAADATVQKTAAEVDLMKAEQVAAAASLAAARAALEEAKGKKVRAAAAVDNLQIQVTAAKREFDRLKLLAPEKVVTQSEVDRAEVQFTGLKSQLNLAQVDLRVTDDTIARSQADVDSVEAKSKSVDLRLKQLVETELPRVRAKAREAQLAATSMVGDEYTIVANVQAQLDNAEFDLEQTTVRAPSDGVVVGMTLRPGQRVASFPMRSWMSFVPHENVVLGAGISQNTLRYINPDQEVEVTFATYPGRIFQATVERIAELNSQAQLQPSGIVMPTPGVDQSAVPFGVRLKLRDETELDITQLPGGAVGTAAIYTDHARATHIIRRVMIRMEAWINYIRP